MEFFSNLFLFLFCQIRIKYYHLGISQSIRAVFAGSNNKGISTEKLKQALPQPVCVLRDVSRRLAVRMSKWSACSFPFAVFGEVGFPFSSKRKSEPFWRIFLRVYYGGVVIFVPEEKSCMTLFTISK